jgi:hypothetical protein
MPKYVITYTKPTTRTPWYWSERHPDAEKELSKQKEPDQDYKLMWDWYCTLLEKTYAAEISVDECTTTITIPDATEQKINVFNRVTAVAVREWYDEKWPGLTKMSAFVFGLDRHNNKHYITKVEEWVDD